jgi:hypothetical protein
MPKLEPPVSISSKQSKPQAAATRLLERDERFLHRVESARKSIRAGRGRRLEDVET